MLYGHRNDVYGYVGALNEFDRSLKQMIPRFRDEDMLIITADHGCDPTTVSTDHSREYIPLIVYGKRVRPVNLGIRSSFADIGATVAEYLGVKISEGKSFLGEIYDGRQN